MSKFKAGDKVVRVGKDSNDFVRHGNTYVVKACDEGYVTVEGSNLSYFEENFELVKDTTQHTPPQFQNMKFRVDSENHSKLIQTELFKLGYSWNGKQELEHLDAYFIFSDQSGKLTWSCFENTFINHKFTEYKLKPITTYTLVKIEPEYVEYNGVRYDKRQFEAAIKQINTFLKSS